MAPDPISPDTARRSTWDDGCTVWHLVDRSDLSVVQESLAAGSATRTHAHDRSREYFHVLSGRAVVAVGPRTTEVTASSLSGDWRPSATFTTSGCRASQRSRARSASESSASFALGSIRRQQK